MCFVNCKKLAGISSHDDSATNLNIRGSSFDHNLILWEGVTLYDRGHLFGMISSINPFSISQTNVYKNTHSASLDNRIGGVVEMSISDQIPQRPEVKLGTNLTEGHLNLNIPVVKDKLSILLAGRQSLGSIFENSPTTKSFNRKVFQSVIIPEDEEDDPETSSETDLNFNYHDLNAKVVFQPFDNIKFKSSLFSSSNSFNYISEFINDNIELSDSSSNATMAISNQLEIRHNDNWQTEISYAHSSYNNENFYTYLNNEELDDINTINTENNIQDQQLKLSERIIFPNALLNVGYVWDVKKVDFEQEEFSKFETPVDYAEEVSGTFHHIFADYTLQKQKHLIQVGTRNTYSALHERFLVSPRLNYRYQLRDNFYGKFSAGVFHQFIRQLYDLEENSIDLSGNLWVIDPEPDSEILRAQKFSLGFIYSMDDWMIDVETYYGYNTGISSQNPTVKNDFIIEDMGETKSQGVDIIITKSTNRLKTALFYSISKNSVFFPLEEFEETEFFNSNIDQTHILNLSNNYSTKHFDFFAGYQYKTGLPYSEQIVVELEDDEEEDYYDLEIESINNERLPHYHRVDLGVQYKKNFPAFQFELGISLLNALDRRNVFSRSFQLTNADELDEDPEILEIERLQLSRTFMMQLRLSF